MDRSKKKTSMSPEKNHRVTANGFPNSYTLCRPVRIKKCNLDFIS